MRQQRYEAFPGSYGIVVLPRAEDYWGGAPRLGVARPAREANGQARARWRGVARRVREALRAKLTADTPVGLDVSGKVPGVKEPTPGF